MQQVVRGVGGAQVMEEGEKLSKKQLAQESLIKKLRQEIQDLIVAKTGVASSLASERQRADAAAAAKAKLEADLASLRQAHRAELEAEKAHHEGLLQKARLAQVHFLPPPCPGGVSPLTLAHVFAKSTPDVQFLRRRSPTVGCIVTGPLCLPRGPRCSHPSPLPPCSYPSPSRRCAYFFLLSGTVSSSPLHLCWLVPIRRHFQRSAHLAGQAAT